MLVATVMVGVWVFPCDGLRWLALAQIDSVGRNLRQAFLRSLSKEPLALNDGGRATDHTVLCCTK